MRFVIALLAAGLGMAEDIPQWVRQEAVRPAPEYPAKVRTVVLLHEEQLTVGPDNRWTERERGVIRVLQASRDKLTAGRPYDTRAGRIREFHGWLIQPGGAVQTFKPQQIVDVSLAGPGQTYDEARAKVLECPSAPPGSVFAYEIVAEEKTVFTQDTYAFQDEMPVLVSRFLLSLPSGWEMKDTLFNHPPVRASLAGGTYTWELRDLPWLEWEENAPPLRRVAPALGVTFFPADNGSAPRFTDWPAVADWASGFVQASTAVTEPIRAKAAQLTGNRAVLEKIGAIAAFSQQVNYVSVDLNVTKGGGYTPHPAEQVLTRNYGDCKDKAAMMKALLEAAGIESYVVLVYAGDSQHVRADWPSSQQFNHAIVAIRVPAEVTLPTVIDHPSLGHLLLFDPTDPFTEVGDLPLHEQGSRMLILAGAQGALVTAPKLPVSASRVESAVEARLDASGLLKASLQRHYYGQSAASMRATAAQPDKDAVRRSFETGFAQRLGGVSVGKLETSDHATDHRFEAKTEFEVRQFGQIQAKLMLSKPGSLVPGVRYYFAAKERNLPIELSASARNDKIRIEIPAGFKVDETPDPVELKTPYGAYKAGYRQDQQTLVFEQSLEITDISVPAAEYSKVREFFNTVAGYQQALVVLAAQ